jgi:peptide/nickel transport system ATP-binding protein
LIQSARANAPHVQASGLVRRFGARATLSERLAGRLTGQAVAREVQAVSNVSFAIARGEVLGLVGESGCGKSTLGRMIAGILPPTAGEVLIGDERVMSLEGRARKRTTRVQMIFQDPYASLDPRMRIVDQIAEGPVSHGLVGRSEAAAYAVRWLEMVGLDASVAQRYPHQFSGGQRQRIAVARALAMQPDTLVCDEPVASLDVSIQAQVLNLLLRLRGELSLTMLFISHHLGVVRHLCDRVAIMYLGRIVEIGSAKAVYEAPQHPYTQALLASVPELRLQEGERARFKPIQGELPSPMNPPPGCHFHLRCPHVQPRCRDEAPPLAGSGGHESACWLMQEQR